MMTVKQLQEKLKELPPDAECLIYSEAVDESQYLDIEKVSVEDGRVYLDLIEEKSRN